jgi:hypothetical protein
MNHKKVKLNLTQAKVSELTHFVITDSLLSEADERRLAYENNNAKSEFLSNLPDGIIKSVEMRKEFATVLSR